jgi:hypothetical protein
MGNRETIIAQIDTERATAAVLKLQAARDGMEAVERFRATSEALNQLKTMLNDCDTRRSPPNAPVADNDPPAPLGSGAGTPPSSGNGAGAPLPASAICHRRAAAPGAAGPPLGPARTSQEPKRGPGCNLKRSG